MGIKDSMGGMVDKAKEKISGDPDAAKGGVDKAGDAVDKATGGKFSEHVDKGQGMAGEQIDKMGTKDQDQDQQ